MKQKKIPLRSCVVTGEKLPKRELVRIVRNKEGEVFVDMSDENFRGEMTTFASLSITRKEDYINGIGDLPKSNVIKLFLENSSSIVVRPSGTEPKLKIYVSVTADSESEAERITNEIKSFAEGIINSD